MPLIHCHLGQMNHLERGVLDGLLRFAGGMPSWEVAVEAWNEWPTAGAAAADAHVVRGNDALVERLRASGRPVVLIGADSPWDLPRIWVDDVAIGRCAARHLLDRGFRHLAYRGDAGIPTSQRRRDGFFAEAALAGVAGIDLVAGPALAAAWSFEGELADTRAVLEGQPRPLGLLAFTCHVGRRVLIAMRGAEAPHRLAVVAGDGDPQVAAASRPRLSCVQTAPERLGYTAGELIASLLAGRRASAQILLQPAGVDDGASAASPAVDDPAITAALDCIGQDGRTGVADLVRASGLARRTLEARFQDVLGESPARLLRRRRLELALRMLADGSEAVAAVAAACGWASPTRFSADIRQATGVPPQVWRRMAQLGGVGTGIPTLAFPTKAT